MHRTYILPLYPLGFNLEGSYVLQLATLEEVASWMYDASCLNTKNRADFKLNIFAYRRLTQMGIKIKGNSELLSTADAIRKLLEPVRKVFLDSLGYLTGEPVESLTMNYRSNRAEEGFIHLQRNEVYVF